MIRSVVTTEEGGRPVFGATYWGLAVIALEIAVTFTAVVLSMFAFKHANSAIDHNCNAAKSLAGIEHAQVERQQKQTTALLAQGLTFGLSRDQLHEAVKRGEAISAQFLAELDDLKTQTC